MKAYVAMLCAVLVSGAVAAAEPVVRTEIVDAAAYTRLRGNSGLTVQWIGFLTPRRGHVVVTNDAGRVHISGEQRAGRERVTLDGDVLRIEARRFVFRGQIIISDTPDIGRQCVRDGTFEFLATGARRYWRLQQMEKCDGLTDYVDIYY